MIYLKQALWFAKEVEVKKCERGEKKELKVI